MFLHHQLPGKLIAKSITIKNVKLCQCIFTRRSAQDSVVTLSAEFARARMLPALLIPWLCFGVCGLSRFYLSNLDL